MPAAGGRHVDPCGDLLEALKPDDALEYRDAILPAGREEFVGLPLAKQDGRGERLVPEPEGLLDPRLDLGRRVHSRQGFPLAVDAALELLRGPSGSGARDPVIDASELELEYDPEPVRPVADQLLGLLRPAAMFAVQGVGDAVEHGRLADAVAAAQHPERLIVGEREFHRRFREAQEVLQLDPFRDHDAASGAR